MRQLLFLILLLTSSIAFAQSQGKWNRTQLQVPFLVPDEVAFISPDTGIVTGIVSYSGLFEYITFDGGKTFIRKIGLSSSKAYYRSLFGIPGNGFVFNGSQYSHDGLSWTYHSDPNINNGKREFCYPLSADSTIVGHVIKDGFDFFSLSADSGKTYRDLNGQIPTLHIVDGVAKDPRHIMLAVKDGSDRQFIIKRTDDTGWTMLSPIDTMSWKKAVTLGPVVRGVEAGHYYVLGGRVDSIDGRYGRIDDYYETKDYGNSWRQINGLAHGRVVRLENPEKNFLVATVRQKPYLNLKIIWYDNPIQVSQSQSAIDSVFISTDDGATWEKDGTTFAGDTIVDMWWLSAHEGYVVSYHDSSTYLSRYKGSAGVTNNNAFQPHLTIYPNPTSSALHFSIPGVLCYEANLLNLLGENISRIPLDPLAETHSLDLPAGLFAGVYRIELRTSQGLISQQFVKY